MKCVEGIEVQSYPGTACDGTPSAMKVVIDNGMCNKHEAMEAWHRVSIADGEITITSYKNEWCSECYKNDWCSKHDDGNTTTILKCDGSCGVGPDGKGAKIVGGCFPGLLASAATSSNLEANSSKNGLR